MTVRNESRSNQWHANNFTKDSRRPIGRQNSVKNMTAAAVACFQLDSNTSWDEASTRKEKHALAKTSGEGNPVANS